MSHSAVYDKAYRDRPDVKVRRREQAIAKAEYLAAVAREYRQRPEVKARRRAYLDATDASRRTAWIVVRRALLSGRLTRVDCYCGRADSQAHHHNGYGPGHELDVVWLCPRHHRLAHLEATE